MTMTFEEKYKEAITKCPEIAKYYDGKIISIPSSGSQVVSCININTSDIELVINGKRTGEIIHLNDNRESEEFSTNDLESKGITGLIPDSRFKLIAFGANVQIKYIG